MYITTPLNPQKSIFTSKFYNAAAPLSTCVSTPVCATSVFSTLHKTAIVLRRFEKNTDCMLWKSRSEGDADAHFLTFL